MTYSEALEWVNGLPRLAPQPGVENTRRLLAQLGSPEKGLRFVHIAGTNGKGSVTTMLSGVLRAAGCKTGTTISPYVLDFRERFQIDGEMIAPETLAVLLSEVRAAADFPIVAFDAVTAAALLWFARERCDIVCMETGLGGRLDSTNAVENTLVAVITRIGFDHMELLGSTLDAIAAEKCGIFKNGCTVVCYPAQPQQAMDEITVRAQKARCPLRVPELDDLRFFRGAPFENRIDYGGYYLKVPLPGKHQAYHAAMVVETALALCEKGFDIPDEAIIAGIEGTRFPARIEVLSRAPLVVLDGAHNADGAAALADTLRAAHVNGLAAVAGILHGKQPEKMLETLSPFISQLYTVTPASPRAIGADELAQLAKPWYPRAEACASVPEALEKARACPGEGVLVFGSLYLAAEARPLLLGTEKEPKGTGAF